MVVPAEVALTSSVVNRPEDTASLAWRLEHQASFAEGSTALAGSHCQNLVYYSSDSQSYCLNIKLPTNGKALAKFDSQRGRGVKIDNKISETYSFVNNIVALVKVS